MSDTIDPAGETITDEPTEQQQPEQPTPEAEPEQQAEDAEPRGKAAREAANYRARLREAEAERDALAGRLEAYQKAEVIAAAQQLAIPALLFADGRHVTDYLDDDGKVDPAKVRAGAADVINTYGAEAKVKYQVARGVGNNPRPRGPVSMGDYLRS